MGGGGDSTIRVVFEGDTAGLESAAERTASAVEGIGASTARSATALEGFGQTAGQVGNLLAGGAIVVGIQRFISSATTFVEQVRNVQYTLGGTAEAASKFTFAMQALGTSPQVVERAMARLSQEVAHGTAAIKAHFTSAEQAKLAHESLADELTTVQEKYQSLAAGTEQTRFVTDLFSSRLQQQLRPVLSQTKEDMKAFADSAQRAGLVLSQQTLTGFEQLKISMNEARLSLTGVAVSIVKDLIPVLENVGKTTSFFLRLFNDLGPFKDFVTLFGSLALVGATVGRGIGFFAQGFSQLSNIGQGVGNLIDKLGNLGSAASGAAGVTKLADEATKAGDSLQKTADVAEIAGGQAAVLDSSTVKAAASQKALAASTAATGDTQKALVASMTSAAASQQALATSTSEATTAMYGEEVALTAVDAGYIGVTTTATAATFATRALTAAMGLLETVLGPLLLAFLAFKIVQESINTNFNIGKSQAKDFVEAINQTSATPTEKIKALRNAIVDVNEKYGQSSVFARNATAAFTAEIDKQNLALAQNATLASQAGDDLVGLTGAVLRGKEITDDFKRGLDHSNDALGYLREQGAQAVTALAELKQTEAAAAGQTLTSAAAYQQATKELANLAAAAKQFNLEAQQQSVESDLGGLAQRAVTSAEAVSGANAVIRRSFDQVAAAALAYTRASNTFTAAVDAGTIGTQAGAVAEQAMADAIVRHELATRATAVSEQELAKIRQDAVAQVIALADQEQKAADARIQANEKTIFSFTELRKSIVGAAEAINLALHDVQPLDDSYAASFDRAADAARKARLQIATTSGGSPLQQLLGSTEDNAKLEAQFVANINRLVSSGHTALAFQFKQLGITSAGALQEAVDRMVSGQGLGALDKAAQDAITSAKALADLELKKWPSNFQQMGSNATEVLAGTLKAGANKAGNITAQAFSDALHKGATAFEQWQKDLDSIQSHGDIGKNVAALLKQLGPEYANLAHEIAVNVAGGKGFGSLATDLPAVIQSMKAKAQPEFAAFTDFFAKERARQAPIIKAMTDQLTSSAANSANGFKSSTDQISAAMDKLNKGLGPITTAFTTFNTIMDGFSRIAADVYFWIDNVWQKFVAVNEALNRVGPSFQDVGKFAEMLWHNFDHVVDAVSRFFDRIIDFKPPGWLIDIAKAAGGVVGSIVHFFTGDDNKKGHSGGTVTAQGIRMHGGGGVASDEFAAILQLGEYVVDKGTVDRFGVDFFRKLKRFHDGGEVSVGGSFIPSGEGGNTSAQVGFGVTVNDTNVRIQGLFRDAIEHIRDLFDKLGVLWGSTTEQIVKRAEEFQGHLGAIGETKFDVLHAGLVDVDRLLSAANADAQRMLATLNAVNGKQVTVTITQIVKQVQQAPEVQRGPDRFGRQPGDPNYGTDNLGPPIPDREPPVGGIAPLPIPTFALGGIVPGAYNSPQLILAHGGEEVVPTDRVRPAWVDELVNYVKGFSQIAVGAVVQGRADSQLAGIGAGGGISALPTVQSIGAASLGNAQTSARPLEVNITVEGSLWSQSGLVEELRREISTVVAHNSSSDWGPSQHEIVRQVRQEQGL